MQQGGLTKDQIMDLIQRLAGLMNPEIPQPAPPGGWMPGERQPTRLLDPLTSAAGAAFDPLGTLQKNRPMSAEEADALIQELRAKSAQEAPVVAPAQQQAAPSPAAPPPSPAGLPESYRSAQPMITQDASGNVMGLNKIDPETIDNFMAGYKMRRGMLGQPASAVLGPQDRPVNIPPPVMRGEGPALGVMSAPAREIDLGPAFSGVQAGGGGGGNGIQGLLTELVQYALSPQGKVRESDEYTTGPAHVDPALIGQIMSLAAGQQGIAQGRAETESAQIANEQMRRLSEIAQGSGAMDQGDLARASLLMGKWPYPWPDSSDQEFKSQLAQQEMSGNRGEALLDFASNQLSMATDEDVKTLYLNMMKQALGMMGINYDEMLLDAQKFLEEQGKAGKS